MAGYENRTVTLDKWAPLNHKAPMMAAGRPHPGIAPSWVGDEHKRRLTAYQLLSAYFANNARYYVEGEDLEQLERRREYGDPALIRDQIASSILGRGASISVDGAEKNPTEPNRETATPEELAQFEEDRAAYNAVRGRLKELLAWGKDEKFGEKVRQGERKTVGLGDGVYWLTWSTKRKRARLRTLDPGFYFPVYPPGGDTLDYPDKVHLAWEYEGPETPGDEKSRPVQWVRRITYELRDISPRKLRYQGPDEQPAAQSCHLTDAAWRLTDLARSTTLFADPFDLRAAFITPSEDGTPMLDLDLGIDFIPVVHVPHGEGDPWGESVALNIAHVLDDLVIADTDAADAADVAGGPPIAVAGAISEEDTKFYGPRTIWKQSIGGAATVLDTSQGLESLQTHVDRLLKRGSNNARVPQEILGQVSASNAESGPVLAYSFGPFESMIEEERQGRDGKFRLILKFTQRLYIHHGVWEAPVQPAGVSFGSALPSDVPALVKQLLELSGGKQILSRATATQVLAEAGFPIDDVPGEARRVEAEDFDGANLLYRATRSPWTAAQYLGIQMPEEAMHEELAKVFRRADLRAKIQAILDGGTPEAQVREAKKEWEAEQTIEDAAKAQQEAAAAVQAQSAAQRGQPNTVRGNTPRGGTPPGADPPGRR